MSEIDWSVGQIVQALEENGLRDNSLLFFTSDNEPWLVFGDHGSTAGNLREGKITTFEGGHRVPAIANWPGSIPSGTVSDVLVTSKDLLPTIARLSGACLPQDKVIDRYDIWPVLSGKMDESPRKAFYYYLNRRLQAVRRTAWKLHVPHDYLTVKEPGKGRNVGVSYKQTIEHSLYNLERDPGETHNMAKEHPQIVEQLMGLIEEKRRELGDAHTDIRGSWEGEPGYVGQVWDKLYVPSR